MSWDQTDRWEPEGLAWVEFTPGPDGTAVTDEVEPVKRRRVGFLPPESED